MTTGYVSGVFDMFHIGHLNIILQARRRCDRLIVGVVDDEVVRRAKHKDPVIPLDERLAIVAALHGVDEVVVDRHVDKFDTWRELRFDVIFKGDDWRDAPKGRKLEADLAGVGARVEYFPYTRHTSSSLLREVLTALASTPVELAPPAGDTLAGMAHRPTERAEVEGPVHADAAGTGARADGRARGDAHIHAGNGAPTLLVTGGAGFVGSTFVRHALAETEGSVVVLDKLTYAGDPRSLDGVDGRRLELVIGDVADEDIVNELVEGVDAVVHFAAESHTDNSLFDPSPFIATNIVGTFRLLEAVRRTGVRLHHVSTDEVYGELPLDDAVRFTADAPYRPSSPHAASKAGSDHLVRAWVRTFGVRATISHCSNNYGPFQHVEKFIPRTITNVLDGVRPRLYGDGANMHDWVHVADHAAAVLRILTDGRVGATYLVGTEREASNRAVVELVLELMGHPRDAYDRVRDRAGHDLRSVGDTTALREELGWRPRYADLRAGLAETIEWYAGNEAWWREAKAQAEARYAVAGERPLADPGHA